MEEPLDVERAAHFLGLKKGTLYNMISRRAIPYHKVGRRVLFRRTELEAWFDSTLVPCVSAPCDGDRKLKHAKVDMEAIVKNAVEQFARK